MPEHRLFLASARDPGTTKRLSLAAGALPQASPPLSQLLLPGLPSQHHGGGQPGSSWGGLWMPNLRLWGAGVWQAGPDSPPR